MSRATIKGGCHSELCNVCETYLIPGNSKVRIDVSRCLRRIFSLIIYRSLENPQQAKCAAEARERARGLRSVISCQVPNRKKS